MIRSVALLLVPFHRMIASPLALVSTTLQRRESESDKWEVQAEEVVEEAVEAVEEEEVDEGCEAKTSHKKMRKMWD